MGNQISSHILHRKKKQTKPSPIIKDSYRYIDGRKYFNIQKDSIYPLPVDEEECDRSQIQHFLYSHIWEGNFSSPIKQILEDGGRVLDICCGPGTWSMEMATVYQRSEFIGVDMIPIFPTEIKPFNLKFIQCNVLDGLPFQNDEFDLVHIQNSSICFTESQWKEIVIPEMVRVTKPNGWVELMEIEPRIENSSKNLERLHDAFINYGKLHDINLEMAPQLGKLLRNHSSNKLANVHQETRKLLYYEKMENMNPAKNSKNPNNNLKGSNNNSNNSNNSKNLNNSKNPNNLKGSNNSKDSNNSKNPNNSKDSKDSNNSKNPNNSNNSNNSKNLNNSKNSKDSNSSKDSKNSNSSDNSQISRTGKLSKENLISFYHSISPIILPILGITQKEYDVIIESIKGDLEKNKCFTNMYRFYARKLCQ